VVSLLVQNDSCVRLRPALAAAGPAAAPAGGFARAAIWAWVHDSPSADRGRDARTELVPVMSAEDLRKGLSRLG
jgi:hypothetical protein